MKLPFIDLSNTQNSVWQMTGLPQYASNHNVITYVQILSTQNRTMYSMAWTIHCTGVFVLSCVWLKMDVPCCSCDNGRHNFQWHTSLFCVHLQCHLVAVSPNRNTHKLLSVVIKFEILHICRRWNRYNHIKTTPC